MGIKSTAIAAYVRATMAALLSLKVCRACICGNCEATDPCQPLSICILRHERARQLCYKTSASAQNYASLQACYHNMAIEDNCKNICLDCVSVSQTRYKAIYAAAEACMRDRNKNCSMDIAGSCRRRPTVVMLHAMQGHTCGRLRVRSNPAAMCDSRA